ncbi:MAG: winged helix-turn-helix domain-containing protein [bacterium]|nr:winged helix-turn-helix domain-containing protein [bacterium]
MQNGDLTWKGLRRTDPDRPRPLADAVLRLIWQERRITRAEIARMANLSRSTVSEIVNEILPMGIVTEVGEGALAGRPPPHRAGIPGRRLRHRPASRWARRTWSPP